MQHNLASSHAKRKTPVICIDHTGLSAMRPKLEGSSDALCRVNAACALDVLMQSTMATPHDSRSAGAGWQARFVEPKKDYTSSDKVAPVQEGTRSSKGLDPSSAARVPFLTSGVAARISLAYHAFHTFASIRLPRMIRSFLSSRWAVSETNFSNGVACHPPPVADAGSATNIRQQNRQSVPLGVVLFSITVVLLSSTPCTSSHISPSAPVTLLVSFRHDLPSHQFGPSQSQHVAPSVRRSAKS